MKYLFHRLEVICRGSIRLGANGDSLWCVLNTVRHEVRELKASLKSIYFEPFQDSKFESFTDVHQKALIEMLNNIRIFETSVLNSDPPAKNRDRVLSETAEIYKEVEDLLRYLHQYFEGYIDKRQIIPELFQAAAFEEVQTFHNQLSSQLRDLPNPELQALIF